MALALSIIGVAVAAFCVWLAVRIVNRRERWAKWTLAGAIGVPVLYCASFGPACWMTCRCGIKGDWLFLAYAPFVWTLNSHASDEACNSIIWYSVIGAPDGCGWAVDQTGTIVAFISAGAEP